MFELAVGQTGAVVAYGSLRMRSARELRCLSICMEVREAKPVESQHRAVSSPSLSIGEIPPLVQIGWHNNYLFFLTYSY